MSILGATVDAYGRAVVSLDARLALAAKSTFANKHRWTCKGNIGETLKLWQSEIQSIALHGARSCELTNQVAQRVRRWELRVVYENDLP